MSQNSKVPDPELVEKEIRVLELRRAGLTWQSISEQTGYAEATGAYAAYKRAIKRVMAEPVEEVRTQELDRLDRMQVAVWNRALKGDDKAINTVLRLMERRARLLGLDAAQRVQAEVITYDGSGDIDRDIERIIQVIQSVDQGGPLSLEGGTGESGTTPTEG